MSDNPAFPDADKTAPGGMSRPALTTELVTEHGWMEDVAKGLSWPAAINAVVKARAKAEREQIMAEHDGESISLVEEALVDAGLDPDDEALMADIEQEAADLGVTVAHVKGEVDDFDPDPMFMDWDHEDLDDEFFAVPLGTVSADEAPMGSPMFLGMPNSKDYIFDGHMGAGPSSAERWMACTASLGAIRSFLETLTPNKQTEFASGNIAARQGTTAHAVAETEARVLLGEVTPEEAQASLLELAVMPDTEGEAYTDEMEEYVSEYVDLVRQYIDTMPEGHVLIEHKVAAVVELQTVTDGEPDLHTIAGSLDLGVIPTPEDPTLVVVDLKYGEGIDVDVEQNPQIRIYALGLLEHIMDVHDGLPDWLVDVDYHIVQPRLGGIKTWTEKVDDLLTWRDEVLSPALTEALAGTKGGAAFTPGEVQCQWCPVRGSCPALIEQRYSEAAELFDVVTAAEFDTGGFPETETMSDEDLGRYFDQIRGLVKLHDEIKAEAQRRLYRGQQVPGFQLVNYTPARSWKEGALEDVTVGIEDMPADKVDLLFKPPTLVTPTAAEKLLGEDYVKVEALVNKPPIRPVVAPVGDRRKTWDGKPPEAMFDVEED